mgnify:CR=1 FL=1
MVESVKNLERLIEQLLDYANKSSEHNMSRKSNPTTWSKKEILGHLIDSGINNLQRFTEIQFEEKPYQLKSYKQDELVQANNYQNAETEDILDLLVSINQRIIDIVKLQTNETLDYTAITSGNEKFDLRYLIEDYVNHFEHHTKQIIE